LVKKNVLAMRFNLYPIYGISNRWDEDPFDTNFLPFDICQNVRIESVADRFRNDAFSLWGPMIGTSLRELLENVRYALVHRYEPRPLVENGEIVGEEIQNQRSEELLRKIAACLRLIRPMRQPALMIRGVVREEDASFDVSGFDLPSEHFLDVPEVQKLFKLRNRDAEDLRVFAAQFLEAMRPESEFWKFRMAVQFHELGHFQSGDAWKARYLLWCSAIESIFTSHTRENQGTLVATSRIKWLLGQGTSIYPPGDLTNLVHDPSLTVGDTVGDLYELRNLIAHGDRVPDAYFNEHLREGLNGGVQRLEVLNEAASFVIRTSLLKILNDQLLPHFVGADSADAFFGAQGLTNRALRAATPNRSLS
jgi:hypothetical protein